MVIISTEINKSASGITIIYTTQDKCRDVIYGVSNNKRDGIYPVSTKKNYFSFTTNLLYKYIKNAADKPIAIIEYQTYSGWPDAFEV